MNTMLKYKEYNVAPSVEEPGLGTKLAGAAAGAVVGRAIGSKVATSLGKDEEHSPISGPSGTGSHSMSPSPASSS